MDFDTAYANGAFIAGAEAFPARWLGEAAAFRSSLGARARLNLGYGPAERQKFDLFLPINTPHGLLVFVHGGYWLAFGRESWSHLAAGAIARGWAVAMPSYTLAPAARITEITQEIAAAVDAACGHVAGPVVVTGHSAGGHLAARMACVDMPITVSRRVTRVVPISPVADLEPLLHTQMNAQLGLTATEVTDQSPARLLLRKECKAHVWVGGQERPAFLWQARTLSENWSCPWTVDPGTHHFNVVDALSNPSSPLTAACLENL